MIITVILYCLQTETSRQLVHGLYPCLSPSISWLPSLVKIFNFSTRHHKKLSSTHLFSVIPVDSCIFSGFWNFCRCLFLYPGADSVKLGQETMSVYSLGILKIPKDPCFWKICFWSGGAAINFSLSDSVPGSLGPPAVMEQ